MNIRKTSIPGCVEVFSETFKDDRGMFVKMFQKVEWAAAGFPIDFPEEFYSVSKKGVLRGLHFQTPPMAQAKIVRCVQGEAFDAVVDLRVGSPTYGKFESFLLTPEKANAVYIPEGFAHGFCALTDPAIVTYKSSRAYSPAHEGGLLWNSAGIPWPIQQPILVPRDQKFPELKNLISSFT